MSSLTDFEADLEMAVLGLHKMLSEAKERGISVAEVDRDAFLEALSIIGSAPRGVRRAAQRWLAKRHPHFRFLEFGGNA